MKKILLLILAGMLVLTACGGGATQTTEKVAETEKVEKTEVKTEAETEAVATEDETEVSTEADNVVNREIVLGQPMEFETFTITIQNYELIKDAEDKDALLIVYDWENTGDAIQAPFMSFIIKGFQDGVEVDESPFVMEGADYELAQSDVQPGAKVEGANDVLELNDINVPLEIELDEFITFEPNPYKAVLDLTNL